jgi:hypothetical protein
MVDRLPHLLLAVYDENILSEEEYMEIVAGLLSEVSRLHNLQYVSPSCKNAYRISRSESSLKNTIDKLKSKICQILGKEMTQTDEVTIKGIDFPCSMFEQLYSDEWIGTNLIHACLNV